MTDTFYLLRNLVDAQMENGHWSVDQYASVLELVETLNVNRVTSSFDGRLSGRGDLIKYVLESAGATDVIITDVGSQLSVRAEYTSHDGPREAKAMAPLFPMFWKRN